MRAGFIDGLKAEKGILILGHRGCRKASVVENTLPAIQMAIDAGADGAEIDVETTLDGKLVVVNRWFLNKHFGIFPWERDLSTIQALGLEKGFDIPGFDAVCEFTGQHPQMILNVEVKSCDRFVCRTAKQVAKQISASGIMPRVIVSSFDVNALLTMKYHAPQVETAYLFRREDRVTDLKEKNTLGYKVNGMVNRSGIKALVADTLHPEITLVRGKKRPLWSRYADVRGKRVNIWTVDREEDFITAQAMGADIIISDNPLKTVAFRSRITG